MAFLSNVVLPGGAKPNYTAPTQAPSQAPGRGFLKSVILPSNLARAREIAELQKQAAEAERVAKEERSLGGIVKNTIKGIPKAALDVGKDIAKGAVEFAVSAGEAPARLANPKLSGVALPPTKVPGLGALGPVQSFQSKTAQNVEAGDSPLVASAKGVGETLINDPVGIAFKPLLITGAVAFKAASKLAGKKTLQEVVDTLHEVVPNIPPRQAATIAPHIAEISDPKEIQTILETSSKLKPAGQQVAQEKAPIKRFDVLRPVAGTESEKLPSKVAKSIESKAIEKKLTEGFEGGVAGYDPITIKDQAERASKIITEDIDTARKIIRGENELPKDLRGSALIAGMEDYALKQGDTEILRELANSPLASETSRSAQELRILAERNPDSPVAIIQDIVKTRGDAAKRRIPGGEKKARAAAVREAKAEIAKANKKQTWDEFITTITCS